jgi:hypothetical protein
MSKVIEVLIAEYARDIVASVLRATADDVAAAPTPTLKRTSKTTRAASKPQRKRGLKAALRRVAARRKRQRVQARMGRRREKEVVMTEL